jgi:hypothetical protein
MTTPSGPLPKWATDGNVTTGPETGQPTKLEPTASDFAQGHIAGTRTPARMQNWWQGKAGEWIEHMAAIQAQNWFPPVDEEHDGTPFGLARDFLFYASVTVAPKWYALGGTDRIIGSEDGFRWDDESSGMADSVTLRCGAANDTHVIVLGDENGSRHYYESSAGGSWNTKIGPVGFDCKDAVWDANASNFIVVGTRAPGGSNQPGVLLIDSSGDPISDQAFATSQVPDRVVTGGGITLALKLQETDTETYSSSNGGLSWQTHTVSKIDDVRDIAYSEPDGLFIAVTGADEVWVSSDPESGSASWTKVATLTGISSFAALATLGGLWIASVQAAGSRGIAWSLDAGVTWRMARIFDISGPRKLRGAQNRFAMIGNGVHMSVRAGLDPLVT